MSAWDRFEPYKPGHSHIVCHIKPQWLQLRNTPHTISPGTPRRGRACPVFWGDFCVYEVSGSLVMASPLIDIRRVHPFVRHGDTFIAERYPFHGLMEMIGWVQAIGHMPFQT